MKGSISVDVLVVGGGPAGSCAAGALAKMGASVLLVEGMKFPREHIGESLLAMSMPYLRTLGVAQAVEAEDFVRKPGAVSAGGRRGSGCGWGCPHPGYAFQVPRARFDDLLLTHAQECGAQVSQEAWARSLVRGTMVASAARRSSWEKRHTTSQLASCSMPVDCSDSCRASRGWLPRWRDASGSPSAVTTRVRGGRRRPARTTSSPRPQKMAGCGSFRSTPSSPASGS